MNANAIPAPASAITMTGKMLHLSLVSAMCIGVLNGPHATAASNIIVTELCVGGVIPHW